MILNVDNCFATPYLQNPADYGADLVTHSATKFIDGQGRVLGGIIVGKQELIDKIRFFSRQTGPAISPFNAWVLSKSLETLSVRMDKHCQNALEVATALSKRSDLQEVRYPFLPSHPQYELAKKQMRLGGGIVTFVVEGGAERARRFIDSLELLSVTANLGDTRTTVTPPSFTTHSKLTPEEQLKSGIYPGSIRVSVGLENSEDILHDIFQALDLSV